MKRYPRVRCWAFPAVDSARLVTLSGDLLSTDDGGRNWSTLIGAEFGKFYSVCFLDTQFGWANTRNGQVFRTRDGGLSWERIATVDDETGPTLGAIGFRDRENGWMIDPFEFWRTTDGGATWLKLTPKDAGPSQGFYCAFNTPSTGWISGSGGAFYRTTDGGGSWQAVHLVSETHDLGEVSFIDRNTGFTFSSTMPAIFWTFDGGEHWETKSGPIIDSTPMGAHSLSFVDARQGWAVTVDVRGIGQGKAPVQTLLHTTDGGATWTIAGVWENEPFLNRVYFVNSRVGWLFGVHNVYRTEDGGANWRVVLEVR